MFSRCKQPVYMTSSSLVSTTYDLFSSTVRRLPDAIALERPGRSPLTYAGLRNTVHTIVGNLRSAGIRPHDHVAIVLPDGPDMACCLLGVSMAAVCAPLNPLAPQHQLETLLADLRARLLITHPALAPAARAAAEKIRIPVQFADNPDNGGDCQPTNACSWPVPDTQQTAIVLHTSGTTARPKRVPLTHTNICVAVDYVCRSLALGPDDRCLSMMPQFHIGGFVDLLLAPLASGGSIISTHGFNADEFFGMLERYRPTWYQGTPATLSMLLTHARKSKKESIASSLRFVRSVAAPLSPRLKQELEDLFRVPVIETFGMTEAAPLITANPLPPGIRKAGSTGPSVGPRVAIMDEAGNLLGAGASGEVVVQGDNIMAGYEDDPEANARAFAHGWFHTGDLGYLDEDGYLFLTGRLKESINRGGEKISPREIDAVLQDHPCVAEAMAFAIPHTTLGEDIAAAVVVKERSVSHTDLIDFCLKRLPVFKVPSTLFFVESLPLGPTGKPQRIGALERLQAADVQAVGKQYAAPRSESEGMLAELWQKLLGVETIGIHDDFFEAGGDSLQATTLLKMIEKQTGLSFPLSMLYRHTTIAGQAQLLDNSTEPSLKPVMAPARPAPIFWILCQFDPQDIPLVPLETCFEKMPSKEKLFLTIEEMAADHVRQIRQSMHNGPYYLGGYSIGGLIAIEAARQLQAAGETVSLLFLVDPHLVDERAGTRPLRRRMVRYYRAFQLARIQDILIRILYLLAFDCLSLNAWLQRTTAHAMLRITSRLPDLHRIYHILPFYGAATARYAAPAYRGRTVLFFRTAHPALPGSDWKRFCPDAEVHAIDTRRHEETVRSPWNSQWLMNLRLHMSQRRGESA